MSENGRAVVLTTCAAIFIVAAIAMSAAASSFFQYLLTAVFGVVALFAAIHAGAERAAADRPDDPASDGENEPLVHVLEPTTSELSRTIYDEVSGRIDGDETASYADLSPRAKEEWMRVATNFERDHIVLRVDEREDKESRVGGFR